MERFDLEFLKNWVSRADRKPLVIRGARQVGKSTLVRDFAKKQGLKLYEINLERSLHLNEIFKSLNAAQIVSAIEIELKSKIDSHNGLLFLDEIQSAPNAIAALRYFYEDMPQLKIIAAGSLLEFVLADHNFSMPVGRIEYLHMTPLTFNEFLFAKEEKFYLEIINNYDLSKEYPSVLHEKLLSLYRQFLVIGGMPEVVQTYLETSDWNEVARVQNNIVDTYEDDFAKYATRSTLLRLQKIYRKIPQVVGNKVKYSEILSDSQAREVSNAIDLLTKAKVFTKVIHSDCSGLPLVAEQDEKIFKMYHLDVGLLNRITDLNIADFLNYKEVSSKGQIAEQFVAQHLLKLNRQLSYWLREKKKGNAEVDFVVSIKGKIIPVEVKSGKSGSMKSLNQFMMKKGEKLGVRFDLNTPSVQTINQKVAIKNGTSSVEYQLISLPIYLTEQLDRFI